MQKERHATDTHFSHSRIMAMLAFPQTHLCQSLLLLPAGAHFVLQASSALYLLYIVSSSRECVYGTLLLIEGAMTRRCYHLHIMRGGGYALNCKYRRICTRWNSTWAPNQVLMLRIAGAATQENNKDKCSLRTFPRIWIWGWYLYTTKNAAEEQEKDEQIPFVFGNNEMQEQFHKLHSRIRRRMMTMIWTNNEEPLECTWKILWFHADL